MNIHRKVLFPILFVVVSIPSIPAPASAGESSRGTLGSSQLIQEILAQISADSIRVYLETLQGFYTRHTNSDTLSDTRGIGAARRWVYRKFQQFSTESGGKLQPSYFEFVVSIRGVTRLNKNILATLPGVRTPEKIYVVSGHLDSRNANNDDFTGFAPGANDDGSGTVISIELARVMSKYEFESTIIFMAVVGEDQGLFGSEAYAQWAKSENLDIRGMITNDVVGNIVGANGVIDSMSVRHFSSVAESTPHRQMSRHSKIVGQVHYPEFTVNLIPDRDRPGRGGDHFSFQDAGYTAVRFTEPNENLTNQHSFTDLVENMSPPYTARVCKLNAAVLATLANAPATPTGLQVLTPGTGTELIARWTTTNTEADLGGYRVGVRQQGSLTYDTIVDAGNTNELTVTGLVAGVPVYISLSAYDTAGYESIFTSEILTTPQVAPTAVQGFATTSGSTSILLRWSANPELDVARYRIYRSLARSSDFQKIDSVNAPTTMHTDSGVQPGVMYYYRVTAVDSDNYESPVSSTVRGRLSTHDQGILLIDGSRDGIGVSVSPSDQQIDDYYAALLSRVAVQTVWDVADSDKVNIRLTDADMGIYSTIVWHSDVRNSATIIRDSTEIKEFLDSGGNLVISGWKLSTSLLGSDLSSTQFPAGSFVPTYLKIDSIRSTGSNEQDFLRAAAVGAGYPDAEVDSARIPNFGGRLVNMDVLGTPLRDEPTTQILFTYVSPTGGSSTFHGKPIGLKFFGSTYKLIILDFPLYYMKQNQSQAIMEMALTEMGEVVSTTDGNSALNAEPTEYALLQNYPNPFNPTTRIEYVLAVESEVTVKIYDLLGQEVQTLFVGRQGAGRHAIDWNTASSTGLPVASGIYFYRLSATSATGPQTSYVEVRKMVLTR